MSENKSYLFDVHTHTNLEPLLENWEQIAIECDKANIKYIDVGTNISTSLIAVEHSTKRSNVYATIGIHPSETNHINCSDAILQLEEIIKNNKKIVAIGECGLDYHYPNYNADNQKIFFINQIKLAIKYHLPLMVHVRDANDDVISILSQFAKQLTIIIHCYAGDIELAKKYLSLGCYFSFNGIITYKRTEALHETIKYIPMNHILSETDAPWLSPVPFRGKTNKPTNINIIVQKLATIKGVSYENMINIINNNAISAFNIE